MKLNEKQKMFLVKKNYVTPKSLDDNGEWEWYKYYIKFYDWELNMELTPYKFRQLMFCTKKTVEYLIELNFQGNDLEKLKKLGSE